MRINSLCWGVIGIAWTLSAPVAQAGTLADSVADFSLTQGSNNWFYGYYPASNLTPSGFTLLDSTEGGCWHHSETWWPSWTTIFADVVHPNGVNSPDQLEWVVRRWVSPADYASITISGELAKFDSGGNGVIGSILVDGATVFSKTLSGCDTTVKYFTVTTSVLAGSTVDFVVKPRTTDYFDSTLFTGVISGASQNTVPEPTTTALVGAGLLLFSKRRRI
jgi:hypothetical protein